MPVLEPAPPRFLALTHLTTLPSRPYIIKVPTSIIYYNLYISNFEHSVSILSNLLVDRSRSFVGGLSPLFGRSLGFGASWSHIRVLRQEEDLALPSSAFAGLLATYCF